MFDLRDEHDHVLAGLHVRAYPDRKIRIALEALLRRHRPEGRRDQSPQSKSRDRVQRPSSSAAPSFSKLGSSPGQGSAE